MMELKCQNCGGQLRVDEADIKVVGELIIYRGRNTLTCQFCGTQFERNADLAEDKGSLGDVTVITGDNNTVINNRVFDQRGQKVHSMVNIGGNVVVGGDIVGGDLIVTSNGNRVNRNW